MELDAPDSHDGHMTNNIQRQTPLPFDGDARVYGGFAPATGPADVEIQSVLSTEDGISGSDDAVNPGLTDRLEIFKYLTKYSSLDRVLESPHITGIAISGTIGMGLFVRTGDVISLAGGLGAVIAYVVGGLMITCVMLCLSEMVAFRHEAGAIFEYPKLFVSHALGFAVGIIYWLAYTTSMVTLIITCADLIALDPGQTAGLTAGLIIVIAITNLLGGVKLYGTLEWLFKWYKLFLIVTLWVVMIYINTSEGIGSRYWQINYLFPPGFNGNLYPNKSITDTSGIAAMAKYPELWTGNMTLGNGNIEIPGVGGTFLGVLTSVNVAIFSFLGVEVLVVAAGEAKNARKDLPRATSWTYIVTICLYFISTLIVSFNVGYDDPSLSAYDGISGSTSAYNSPFVISVRRSNLSSQFVTAFQWCFFFSAATTANTNVYVASRTLFALASNSNVHWIKKRLGRTSQGKTPLLAIGVSLLPALLALTGISYGKGYSDPAKVVNVFSEIATVSFLCVYVAECWTFIQFMKGLGMKRDQTSYTNLYRRIPRQPFYAWCGLISCSFFILLNGWHSIFAATAAAGDDRVSAGDVALGLIASYLGPLLFLLLLLLYKTINRMPRKREKNFWALRSKIPPGALSAVELRELPAEQRAAVMPTSSTPEAPKSTLRRIWLYT